MGIFPLSATLIQPVYPAEFGQSNVSMRKDHNTTRRFLFTWELGGGLGHVLANIPLIQCLLRSGHRVAFAVRNFQAAARTGFTSDVQWLQAPFALADAADPVHPACTFAHILHNVGFDSDDHLRGRVLAWQELFEQTTPDVIICDHSPTALLACRGNAARQVVIGSGFLCPPNVTLLPNLRPAAKLNTASLEQSEAEVLQRVNRILQEQNRPPLDYLAQLYADADAMLMTTFAELDHYSGRQECEYWGPQFYRQPSATSPPWPTDTDLHIFAYLKPIPAIDELLELLQVLGQSTLIYAPEMDQHIRDHYASKTLRFMERPLDLSHVAQQADLTILNGNHGTVAEMLLGGVPILNIPITLEQSLLARRVEEMGAGLAASCKDAEDIARKLGRMLEGPEFKQAAERFAKKYQDYDADLQVERMVEILV